MRAIHWFRNDLRLADNAALSAAASRADELIPAFIIDDHLIDTVHASPTRQAFLHDCLARLHSELARRGQALIIRRGEPVREIARLLADSKADLLTFNRDYTPYAKRRDAAVRGKARAAGAAVEDHKDRVVF